jgi:hypothetical protein
MFLMVFLWTIRPQEIFAQNSRLDWSAFGAGFAVPAVSNTVAKSSVGQPFVGRSQLANTLVESGFLANPLLRGIVVGVNEQPDLPTAYALSQNYPNPFNPSTTIRFALPVQSKVSAEVYNILGQRVATLVNEVLPAGYHTIEWNGTGSNSQHLSSGVYFLRLAASGDNGRKFNEVRKLMMLK